MSEQNPYVLGLQIFGTLFKAYQEYRETNVNAGNLTEGQIAEFEAQYVKYYPDPLAGQPTGTLPPPQPPAQPVDPTTNILAQKDDAIALAETINGLGGQQYVVVERADGKFQVYPASMVSYSGGTQVWP